MKQKQIIVLLLLLVFPVVALVRLDMAVRWYWILGYAILISGATILLYRHDKKRAEAQGWRTSEQSLHLLELAGGWPGAYVAQRLFHHKIAKVSYQIVFWIIVAGYQLVSFDYVIGWRVAKVFGGLFGS